MLIDGDEEDAIGMIGAVLDLDFALFEGSGVSHRDLEPRCRTGKLSEDGDLAIP